MKLNHKAEVRSRCNTFFDAVSNFFYQSWSWNESSLRITVRKKFNMAANLVQLHPYWLGPVDETYQKRYDQLCSQSHLYFMTNNLTPAHSSVELQLTHCQPMRDMHLTYKYKQTIFITSYCPHRNVVTALKICFQNANFRLHRLHWPIK